MSFHGLDKPGALELRKATRPAHLAGSLRLSPRVKIGGPMLAEDGATPVGSMLVLEAESLEAAKAEYARDPYALAGLWAETSSPSVQLARETMMRSVRLLTCPVSMVAAAQRRPRPGASANAAHFPIIEPCEVRKEAIG
jgi:uncharacterized protein YciI